MKRRVSILTTAICLALGVAASADGITFESETAAKGDAAALYTSQVPLQAEGAYANIIYMNGINATVGSETNIRVLPDANSTRLTTIGPDARLKVWGTADNGWCQVFCMDADGSYCFGYIKGDLLHEEE